MTKPYVAKRYDLSGFEITCACLPDGTLKNLANNQVIADFPTEVELLGVVYTLEDVQVVGTDAKGNQIKEGMYA